MSEQLNDLILQIQSMRDQYSRAKGIRDSKSEELTGKMEQRAKLVAKIEINQKVQILLGWVSARSREQLKMRIEETVSAALQAIFCDDRMEFKIDLRTLNSKPSAEWTVVSVFKESKVTANPEDSRGGGVVDIVSLALRLAMIELARPKPEGPIILDEIGKHVSAEYAPNVAGFLKQYAAKTGRQIILITHQVALAEVADVSYQVNQTDGISEVIRK